MKKITLTLYEYSELSSEAKKQAYENYNNESFDMYDLQVYLDQTIEPLLDKYGIVPVSTTDKEYSSTYARIYFSLAHCQGDGVMFEGTFKWKQWTVNIKQSGRYYHKYSRDIQILNDNGDEAPEADENAFEKIYNAICNELEREGYSYMEELKSETYFEEVCNSEGWMFREDGTREHIQANNL